jgi:hypothetical protein
LQCCLAFALVFLDGERGQGHVELGSRISTIGTWCRERRDSVRLVIFVIQKIPRGSTGPLPRRLTTVLRRQGEPVRINSRSLASGLFDARSMVSRRTERWRKQRKLKDLRWQSAPHPCQSHSCFDRSSRTRSSQVRARPFQRWLQ